MRAMNFPSLWSSATQSVRADGWLRFLMAGALLIASPLALADLPQKPVSHESAAVMIAQADAAQAASRTDARAMVQLMNQLDGLNRDLNILRGKIEELSNSVLNAEKRQKDMYLDLDTRLRRVESSNTEILTESKKAAGALSDLRSRVERLEEAATTGAAMKPPASSVSTGGEANNAAVLRDYEAAMAQYRAGEYQDAIAAFQAIVQKYPQHPLAVNAQYWTGDSFYQLRAYRSAIDAQKQLIGKYPNSTKAADAMLNMGSAFLGLDDTAGARQTWETLIATHPGSRAAKNAKERLERLP